MDGYVRAGVMVLTEQVKSISNSRNKDQKSTSCCCCQCGSKPGDTNSNVRNSGRKNDLYWTPTMGKVFWELLWFEYEIFPPPKAHVFEHLVQAKNAVCEGCRTFRRWRKKLVGAWGGPWGVMSWVHFLFILPLQHDQLASWPYHHAFPTTMEGILPNCNPEETFLP